MSQSADRPSFSSLRQRLRAWLRRSFKGPTLYWARIEAMTRWNRLNQRLLQRQPSRLKSAARWLNVGCGRFGVDSEDWFNVDALRLPGVDFAVDAGRPLPFADQRFEGVFCEHFVEHLTAGEARAFFAECHRLLAPGGTLRISVPDGELYLREYVEDGAAVMRRARPGALTPMEVVNQVFRQGSEHQYCYDAETLVARLLEAGFDDARRTGFRQGRCRELLIDREERADESLYVEAWRGGGRGTAA